LRKLRAIVSKLIHADILIFASALILLAVYLFADLSTHLSGGRTSYSPFLRCLLLVIICCIVYLGAILLRQRTGVSLIRPLLWVFFLFYLYLLLSFTLFDVGLRLSDDRLAEEGLTKRQYYLKWFVNFIPFNSIYTVYIKGLVNGYVSIRYTVLNILGNLCAFMPLSFFLPRFFKPLRHWYLFLPAILFSVAAVEGLQFAFMVGSCDVDDLILNAGGALLLLFVLKIPPIRRFCDRLETGDFG